MCSFTPIKCVKSDYKWNESQYYYTFKPAMLKLQTLQWKQLSNRSSLWAKNTTVLFSTTEIQNIKFLYLSFQFVFVKINYISWSWTLMKIFLSEKLSLLSFSNSSVYLPYLNKKLTCYKMIVVKTWLLIVIDGGHLSVFDIRFFFCRL